MVQETGRGCVSALYVHPVKSCHRVEVDHAVVGALGGFVGDREWQVVRPDGVLITQRELPALTRVYPSPIEGGIRLEADGDDRCSGCSGATRHLTEPAP
jgi:uncharacterized protein YcbX